MSVLISGISSAILARWASKERDKVNDVYAKIERIRSIPVVTVSSLMSKSFLPHQDAKKLVFVRGLVLSRACIDIAPPSGNNHDSSSSSTSSMSQDSSSSSEGSGSSASATSTVRASSKTVQSSSKTVQSSKTGVKALVVEERVTRIYDGKFFNYCTQGEKKLASMTRKQVPFVIADCATKPCTEFVIVNLEGLDHQQVPLQKVSTNLNEVYDHSHKGFHLKLHLLTEEAILQEGSVVSAVGIFSAENGVPSIKPCEELGCFLTSKTNLELMAELRAEAEKLSGTRDFLTQVSIGLAGFAVTTFAIRVLRHLCDN